MGVNSLPNLSLLYNRFNRAEGVVYAVKSANDIKGEKIMYKIKGISLKTYKSTNKMQRQKGRSISTELPVEKKTLTRTEKEMLARKIQEDRDENINKSFVGRANPVYLTVIVIVLIALFFAFIAWVVIHTS